MATKALSEAGNLAEVIVTSSNRLVRFYKILEVVGQATKAFAVGNADAILNANTFGITYFT